MSPRPFVRARDGSIELRFAPAEADVLRPLLHDMLGMLEAEEKPESARRLYPDAYPEDDEAQAEFARYTRDELTASKVQALRAADATFGKARLKRGVLTVRLNEDEQQAWLGVLNDLRLVLGTRLDVTDEMFEEESDPNDPDASATQLYLYLGWLEQHLVEALLG